MNVWLVAATVLVVSLGGCAWVAFRSPPSDRLVAFELAGIIDTLIFLLLAAGFDRDVYYDLALALALLSLAGGLVFAHFMERWV